MVELNHFPSTVHPFELKVEWLENIVEDQKLFRKLNELGRDVCSLLIKAASQDHWHIVVELFKKYSVAVDTADSSRGGMTALHAACRNGRIETIQLLLDYGADLEKEDDKGRRAIHYAVKR